MERENKAKLSRAILDMKFMKKSKERVEKEEEDAEGQAMYSNEITEEMRKGGKYEVVEVGINYCRDLIEGRMSFGGMNPEIERLMSEEYSKRVQKSEKEKETDVSDLEMAKRYNPLVETMGKKMQHNNKKPNNKRKFIKPPEMD